MNNTEAHIHQIKLVMRKELTIQGVKEVASFDEGGAVLQTTSGEMTIEGKEIHVGILDIERGVVTLTGKIDAILYSDPHSGEKGSFLKRKNR